MPSCRIPTSPRPRADRSDSARASAGRRDLQLPGVASGLKFDGDTLGKIFSGAITTWNDPAIKTLNPGISLPSTPIAVATVRTDRGPLHLHRLPHADQSCLGDRAGGSKTSVGKTVAWPVGIGGKGNEGVSAVVSQTAGGIGYVELDYAIAQHQTYADVKNKEACSSSRASRHCCRHGRHHELPLRPANRHREPVVESQAYPITGLTWALVYQNRRSRDGSGTRQLFSWILTKGQDLTGSVNYTPLGPTCRPVIAQVKKITLNGTPVSP